MDALDAGVVGLSARHFGLFRLGSRLTISQSQGNPTFTKSEFPNEMLANLEINFVAIVDSSNHLVFAKGYDLRNSR